MKPWERCCYGGTAEDCARFRRFCIHRAKRLEARTKAERDGTSYDVALAELERRLLQPKAA